jgi:hypothetical protein
VKDVLDRFRSTWDALNERERRLFGALGAVFLAALFMFPLFLTMQRNSEIEEHNAQLRAVLELIAQERPKLQSLTEARRSSSARYLNKTPPLGSYLESEASAQGLTIREVTDQPEKSTGTYRRRSATASIAEIDLTSMMRLLSSIVASKYPVAVQHVQIEHYQPGDKYRFSLGVVTFDKKTEAAQPSADADGKKPAAAEGG